MELCRVCQSSFGGLRCRLCGAALPVEGSMPSGEARLAENGEEGSLEEEERTDRATLEGRR